MGDGNDNVMVYYRSRITHYRSQRPTFWVSFCILHGYIIHKLDFSYVIAYMFVSYTSSSLSSSSTALEITGKTSPKNVAIVNNVQQNVVQMHHLHAYFFRGAQTVIKIFSTD